MRPQIDLLTFLYLYVYFFKVCDIVKVDQILTFKQSNKPVTTLAFNNLSYCVVFSLSVNSPFNRKVVSVIFSLITVSKVASLPKPDL